MKYMKYMTERKREKREDTYVINTSHSQFYNQMF